MTLCHVCGLPLLAEQCADHHPACPNRHHPATVDCTCPPSHPWCCSTCKETPMSGRFLAPDDGGDDAPMSGCAPFLAALVLVTALIAGIATTLR